MSKPAKAKAKNSSPHVATLRWGQQYTIVHEGREYEFTKGKPQIVPAALAATLATLTMVDLKDNERNHFEITRARLVRSVPTAAGKKKKQPTKRQTVAA